MSRSEQRERLHKLLREQRWASLATLSKDGWPEASMVAYVFDETLPGVYLHLSELAAHTRNMQKCPQTSLAVSECDDGKGDPQQLARATLFGRVTPVSTEETGYAQARERYLRRLPDSEPLFSFGDFHLFRFIPETIRFVGGFAQAYTFRPEELTAPDQG